MDKKKQLIYVLLAAIAGYIAFQVVKARKTDALTQAAQLQAKGQPVPDALKQQIAREHL